MWWTCLWLEEQASSCLDHPRQVKSSTRWVETPLDSVTRESPDCSFVVKEKGKQFVEESKALPDNPKVEMTFNQQQQQQTLPSSATSSNELQASRSGQRSWRSSLRSWLRPGSIILPLTIVQIRCFKTKDVNTTCLHQLNSRCAVFTVAIFVTCGR